MALLLRPRAERSASMFGSTRGKRPKPRNSLLRRNRWKQPWGAPSRNAIAVSKRERGVKDAHANWRYVVADCHCVGLCRDSRRVQRGENEQQYECDYDCA